jgi:hypothetical protein
MLRSVPRTAFGTPNDQANRPAALTATEGEAAYRPVRLSAGLGVICVIAETQQPSSILAGSIGTSFDDVLQLWYRCGDIYLHEINERGRKPVVVMPSSKPR